MRPQAGRTGSRYLGYGPGEKYYVYPAGQRTFDFTGSEGSESPPFIVVSKDNQELTVSGGLTFHLDTSCEDEGGMLREFHEEIGLKFQPMVDGDGQITDRWLEMLRFYIGHPLQRAMTTEAQKYDWLALYNDPATRAAFETAITRFRRNPQVAQARRQTVEGTVRLLCGFNPPDVVVFSLALLNQVGRRHRIELRFDHAGPGRTSAYMDYPMRNTGTRELTGRKNVPDRRTKVRQWTDIGADRPKRRSWSRGVLE
ncbi:hypothetical protein [Micromonospora sp. LOL_015]|uniref:hypothetical protein n=2 Tax=unclassified Micromonospora TaxID=2617518 RepID=UPI003A8662D2